MKFPYECNSINEIRSEIDNLDKQIIDLLGQRYLYVQEIVNFKSNENDVLAHERYKAVLQERRKWAEENGLNPDVIENAYKILIAYFIDEQMRLLKEKTK
jgi:isochorismate pyruvate lyase